MLLQVDLMGSRWNERGIKNKNGVKRIQHICMVEVFLVGIVSRECQMETKTLCKTLWAHTKNLSVLWLRTGILLSGLQPDM